MDLSEKSRTVFAATWPFGRLAVEEAWRVWQARLAAEEGAEAALLAAVEAGTAAVELDEAVASVGVGGLPNAEGRVELDAAFMDGRTMAAGAVAAVQGFVPAISLARRVAERTEHVILAAAGAEAFARREGFASRELLTAEARMRYEAWKRDGGGGGARDAVSASSHDTVGVIGWHGGRAAAACSTSGLAWKLPGRVGDSPIVGAGLYADDEAGAAVATGRGEDILKATLSSRAVEGMRRGLSAQAACAEAVSFLARRVPGAAGRRSAVVAVRRDGDVGAAATKPGFTAWLCRDGRPEELAASNPVQGPAARPAP